jgi:predicted regulator of Ras-like GTPase activity (Roadblock/LC7/MglB family)
MPALHDVLVALADRPDVAGVLVVSDEGLVIDAATRPGTRVEAEAAAALAATAQRSLAGLGEALGHGAPREVVIDAAGGTAVLQRLPSGATLLVIAAGEGDLGQLLHDLRRHGPALRELV